MSSMFVATAWIPSSQSAVGKTELAQLEELAISINVNRPTMNRAPIGLCPI